MGKSTMPIWATPYNHQREAFDFAMHLMGGDADISVKSCNATAYFMEM
ncbi:hypothetical protein FACS1894105_05340 [Clostridia bacterium]|nr:hypothetical protein FACS1894105_05340 [Clostridia bacterium]